MISIIIPVYNVEKYLEDCLKSVLSQTYKDYEVVLVDDGSTDSSSAICDEYAKKHNNIRVIHKKNGGLSSARNTGIDEAKGEYILFLDSDDLYVDRTALMAISSMLIGALDTELIAFKIQKFIDGKNINIPPNNKEKYFEINDESYATFFKNRMLFASACYLCISRNMIIKNNLYFEYGKVSEDVEWFYRLLTFVTKIHFIDKIFYGYRMRANSISHSVTKKTIIDLCKHIETMINYKNNGSAFIGANEYISEQVSNLAIVLSHSNENSFFYNLKKYRKLVNKPVRTRSKLIYLSMKIFGEKNTIKLLKRVK